MFAEVTQKARLPTGRLDSFMLEVQQIGAAFCFVLFFCTRTKRRDSAKTTLTALIYCVDLLKDSVAGEESCCRPPSLKFESGKALLAHAHGHGPVTYFYKFTLHIH